MIEREHNLSLTRQAELLDLSRASLCYEPVPTSEVDLELMHASHRRAAPGAACVRQPDAARSAEPTARHGGRAQVCGDVDAKDGHRGHLPAQEHFQAPSPAHRVSLPTAGPDHQSAEPCVGRRHHLHPDGAWLCVPVRGDGLVHAQSPLLAPLEHAHGGLLCRGGGGSDRVVRQTRDL